MTAMRPSSWILSALVALIMSAQAAAQTVEPLWPNGAPGSEAYSHVPERAQDWWVRDVHNPSLTVFLPKEPTMRTAIIVVPGGGHHSVVFKSEGVRPAKFLQDQGIAAFALKYHLARVDGSPYDIETHAAEDLRRAMRWVRAHADSYNVDPNRIGILAFSAGGELANLVTFGDVAGDDEAADPVERESSRPDFMAQIYPGPIGLPDHHAVTPPPAFFLSAYDDRGPELTISRHLQLYRQSDAPVEVHILGGGGHAFNMGGRSERLAVSNWPERLTDWLHDLGYLQPPEPLHTETQE